MEISFKGKRVLVTGAGQGIGRGIATALSKAGAFVIAVSKTKKYLDTLEQELKPNIKTISVDLSDWNAAREGLKGLGPVDALVNNAAIAILKPFLNFTEDDFDKIFDINVKALFNVSQIVAKEWVESGTPGSIVNVSSQAAQVGLLDHAIYCSSKGAVDALTRALVVELGPHNIRVNCVNPTVIMTEMGKLGWADPAKGDPMRAKIPLRRFGEVEEVSDAVLYLLSDKASMITGATLPVDGGYLAS